MCRLAAYLGPPAPLSKLLSDPPHGLVEQAWAPREQTYGKVNVDGTGVAWWPERDPEPLRYVTVHPPWSDPNLPLLAPRLCGVLQLAAVRSATPGIPYGPGSVPPFVLPAAPHRAAVVVAHNGWVGGYRGPVGREMLDRLPDDLHSLVDAVSDSLALAVTVLKHVRVDPGGGLAAAVTRSVAEVSAICRTAGQPAVLTLVVADGETIIATRAATNAASNGLYVLSDGARWPNAVLVASEPLDGDPGWSPVPDASLVQVERGVISVSSLAEDSEVNTAAVGGSNR